MNEKNQDSMPAKTATPRWGRIWASLRPAPRPVPVAYRLYSTLVDHARYPLYYDRLGVPDTPEGRFEILALHVGLVVRRLTREGGNGRGVAQSLFDLMFADLDVNLRELGVGDLSVGRQIKRLASQFYARLEVLNEAFDQEDHQRLGPMLAGNVYHGGRAPSAWQLDALTRLVVRMERRLRDATTEALLDGRLNLPAEGVLRGWCDA